MAKSSRNVTTLSHIEPDIRGLAVPIDDLRLDDHQSRTHGRRSIDEIKRSLEVHGQKVPLVVQRDGLVTKAGHGRILAARELGWTHLAVVRSDDAPELLRQYAIRDNRSAEHAEWDLDALARELDELDLDAGCVGFTDEELRGPELDIDPLPDMTLLDGTSTDRDGQGVASTMGAVAGAKSQIVIIGDLRLRVETSLYERLVEHVNERFSAGVSYLESFAAVLMRGLDAS